MIGFHGNRVACRDVAGLNPAKRRSCCSRVELLFLVTAAAAFPTAAGVEALQRLFLSPRSCRGHGPGHGLGLARSPQLIWSGRARCHCEQPSQPRSSKNSFRSMIAMATDVFVASRHGRGKLTPPVAKSRLDSETSRGEQCGPSC